MYFSLTTTVAESTLKPGMGQPSGLGDLTVYEVDAIQNIVDKAGRPLNIVGSAARGERRLFGEDLPVGKGEGTRSDIDYVAPGSSIPYFKGMEAELPSVDPGHGMPSGGPSFMNLGCGVTANDIEDAKTLLKQKVFPTFGEREILEIVPDCDVSELEPNHVRPNIGAPDVRGVWFPVGL